MDKHREKPEERLAQKTLAREFIVDLHGEEEYEKALKTSEALFKGNIKDIDPKDIEKIFKNVDNFEINENKNIVDLLVETTICSSKREAREFLSNGSISVNGERITDLEFVVSKDIAIDNKFVVIRRGKKKYYLIKFK